MQLSRPQPCCLLPRGGSCGPSSTPSDGKPTGIRVFTEKPTDSWEHCSKTGQKKYRPPTLSRGMLQHQAEVTVPILGVCRAPREAVGRDGADPQHLCLRGAGSSAAAAAPRAPRAVTGSGLRKRPWTEGKGSAAGLSASAAGLVGSNEPAPRSLRNHRALQKKPWSKSWAVACVYTGLDVRQTRLRKEDFGVCASELFPSEMLPHPQAPRSQTSPKPLRLRAAG